MYAGPELGMPVLADRGTVLALVFLTLILVGMLVAGFGELRAQLRV